MTINLTGVTIPPGARSDFPRRPSVQRQLDGLIAVLSDSQRRLALRQVAAYVLAGVDGQEALWAGLADALGAPGASRWAAADELIRRLP